MHIHLYKAIHQLVATRSLEGGGVGHTGGKGPLRRQKQGGSPRGDRYTVVLAVFGDVVSVRKGVAGDVEAEGGSASVQQDEDGDVLREARPHGSNGNLAQKPSSCQALLQVVNVICEVCAGVPSEA
jgi:hypothetical protein